MKILSSLNFPLLLKLLFRTHAKTGGCGGEEGGGGERKGREIER